MAQTGRYREARIFIVGAACGFLGGAVAVWLVVWQLGIGPVPRPVDDHFAEVRPPAVETGRPAPAAQERTPDQPASTIGRDQSDPPVVPEAPVSPTIVSDSATELRQRRLEVPVEGIRADQLTRQFTDPRGTEREHEALDILAPRNTPVVAVEAGRIARLFLSKPGGITVYQFDPSERYCYYYAHLERYADGLHEGDRVTRGQILGYVGTSGNAPKDAPHLHFAVTRLNDDKHWWEGTPLDPYDILR